MEAGAITYLNFSLSSSLERERGRERNHEIERRRAEAPRQNDNKQIITTPQTCNTLRQYL
jgi:hypothetical protein